MSFPAWVFFTPYGYVVSEEEQPKKKRPFFSKMSSQERHNLQLS